MSCSSEIELLNVESSGSYPHQLIYIAGKVLTFNKPSNFVYVAVNSSNATKWLVRDGQFKCFLMLSHGNNQISFQCENGQKPSKEIVCKFEPMNSQNTVKFVYIKCKESLGEFQTLGSLDNSLKRGLELLEFSSLICQLFFAESLVGAGLPRRTFTLAPVEVIESELTETESMTDDFLEKNNKIFEYFYRELMEKEVMKKGVKVVGILGCTR